MCRQWPAERRAGPRIDEFQQLANLPKWKNLEQKRAIRYDKDGDNHYDIISAFIKSMRGSDPDAAVFYLAKMLYGGESITFIARRIMICACEDVGNADPNAICVATACAQAVERNRWKMRRFPGEAKRPKFIRSIMQIGRAHV